MAILKVENKNRGVSQEVIVDDADLDLINQHKWVLHIQERTVAGRLHTYYRIKSGKRWLHRWLMNVADSSIHVDHINGNCLDNRRSNLRPTTAQGNMCNRTTRPDSKSGVKGLKQRKDGSWVGCITHNKKRYEKTSKDRDIVEKWLKRKRKELHGSFANHGDYTRT